MTRRSPARGRVRTCHGGSALRTMPLVATHAWATGTRLAGRTAAVAVALFLGVTAGPSAGEVPGPDSPVAPLSFDACVELALRQSPYLTESVIEVSVQRLGEADSRSDFFPQFALRSRYYFQQPPGTDRPYSLEFAIEPYNPYAAKFSLEAQRLLTRLAELAHRQAISDGLLRLGRTFLDLEAMTELEEVHAQSVALARQQAASAAVRRRRDALSDIEQQLAEKEPEIQSLQVERVRLARAALLEGLGSLLGLPDGAVPGIAATHADAQVLAGFRPGTQDWATAQQGSIELRSQPVRERLQRIHITAARAAYVPDLLLGLQTPDPLTGVSDEDFYFSVGVRLPIWDGWKRAREVTRQRERLVQLKARGATREADLRAEWRNAENAWRAAEVDARLAALRVETTALRLRQAELTPAKDDGNGGDPVAAARRQWLEARVQGVMKRLELSRAALQLRYLSGELLRPYCAEMPGEP